MINLLPLIDVDFLSPAKDCCTKVSRSSHTFAALKIRIQARSGHYMLLVIAYLLLFTQISIANEAENVVEKQVRIYRSPEERREAGFGTELTDWLKISGLLEVERERITYKVTNNTKQVDNPGAVSTLQLGLELSITDWLESQIVLESEYDNNMHSYVDEALISADWQNWGFTLGRINVPFGEYYSHFITGPILEVTETRADALVVDYTFFDSLELAAYLFEGRAKQRNNNSAYDWGLKLEFTLEDESIRLGAGYLSDLAENEEKILEDFSHWYRQRVSAWNVYALVGFLPFELTAEYSRANRAFLELDDDVNQPAAYNIEFAYFIRSSLQVALRYEDSDEINNQPEKQYGVSATWRPGQNLVFSIEHLWGKYKSGTMFDDNSYEITANKRLAAQLSLEF